MYSSQNFSIPGAIIFMFIVAYIAGLLPVYSAYKVRNRRLMIVALLCGLLTVLAIPPMISAVLVAQGQPKRGPYKRIPWWMESVYLVLYVILCMLLPMVSMDALSMSGYKLLVTMLLSYTASVQPLPFILFAILAIVYSIVRLGAPERNLFAFRNIVLIQGSLGVALFINTPAMMIEYGYAIQIGYILMPLMMTIAVLYAWYATYQMPDSRIAPITGGKFDKSFQDNIRNFLSNAGKVFAGDEKTVRGDSKGHAKPVPKAAAFCPQCGAPVKVGQRYCGKCGKAL